jgi:uncharacterized Zn finger protein
MYSNTRTRHRSPCCGARSVVRRISLSAGQIVLRCSACGIARIEPLKAVRQPSLRLVGSTDPGV